MFRSIVAAVVVASAAAQSTYILGSMVGWHGPAVCVCVALQRVARCRVTIAVRRVFVVVSGPCG
jgi:hypothetical protein